MDHPDTDSPVLLRVPQAARILGVSRSKAYELINAGRLPVIRLAGSIRVNRAALLEMIERETSTPTA